MWILILIVIVVIVCMSVTKKSEPNELSQATAKPAEIGGIMEFLHAYSSLRAKHDLYDTGVLISWRRTEMGYEIGAETTIFKIDGEDASDAVDVLRMMISRARQDAEQKARLETTDAMQIYSARSKAADNVILDYFGTEHLQGSFWDIDDCEYVDGRYLRFNDNTCSVYEHFNQGLRVTLAAIEKRIRELYPRAQFEKNGNTMRIEL